MISLSESICSISSARRLADAQLGLQPHFGGVVLFDFALYEVRTEYTHLASAFLSPSADEVLIRLAVPVRDLHFVHAGRSRVCSKHALEVVVVDSVPTPGLVSSGQQLLHAVE